MQGARQSALYFTCHCLIPFLLLLLQGSVSKVYHMESTMCLDGGTDYSATALPFLFSRKL